MIRRYLILAAYAAAVVLLIPAGLRIPGGLAWGLAMILILRDRDPAYRRRMATLLGVVLLLAFAPIETGTSTRHMLHLGGFFLAVILLPWLLLRRSDPGVIAWRFWPRRFRRADLVYAAISAPLAWAVIGIYFFRAQPDLATHWNLPGAWNPDATFRLILGINLVGIWDELFFINTGFGILRSLYPKRVANAAQAVLYTSVLYAMAFTGIGPLFVGFFALTQGAMYEGSRSLLWVLLVHIVVDFFLVGAILAWYYPDRALIDLWLR